jgi:hypothetical protein
VRLQSNLAHGPSTDNQSVCWLMVEPENGFAASQWQHSVGDVLLLRSDLNDFGSADWSMCHDFAGFCLDDYGDGRIPNLRKKVRNYPFFTPINLTGENWNQWLSTCALYSRLDDLRSGGVDKK